MERGLSRKHIIEGETFSHNFVNYYISSKLSWQPKYFFVKDQLGYAIV